MGIRTDSTKISMQNTLHANTRYIYKQHFHKQSQAGIGKQSSKR